MTQQWGWGGGWTDKGRALRQMVRRLEVENSILIGRDVFHHIKQQGPAVAWSIGDDIYFNGGRLPDPTTREDIVFVTGVNKHELCHVMYTPTQQDFRDLLRGTGCTLASQIENSEAYSSAWNILEDQRIETMYAKRYANAKPYFTAAFNRIILESTNADMLGFAYLLARGRRYLPVKVRRLLKRRFKAQAAIPEARRIIDAYLKLNLFRTADIVTADKLVLDFLKLIDDHDLAPNSELDKLPQIDTCQTGKHMMARHIDRNKTPEVADGNDSTRKDDVDQRDIVKTLQKVADDMADDDGSTGDGTDAEDAQGPSEGSGTQGTGDIDGTPMDGDQGQPGKGAGTGGGDDSAPPSDDDVAAALEALMDEAFSTDEVQKEIQAVRTFIRTQADIKAEPIRSWKSTTDDMPPLARQVTAQLRKLEVDADPSWDYRQTTGRLNVQRVMRNPDDRDHAFDRWEDGGTAGNDQEWVVLLDQSGSMHAHFNRLGQSAWIIKKAGDTLRSTVTVFGYGSANEHRVIYPPNAKAMNEYPELGNLGGTEPGSALVEAFGILDRSRKAQKGLLVMTDGDWDGGSGGLQGTPFRTAEAVIDGMNKMGVLTHLVHLGFSYGGSLNRHSCRTAGRIKDIGDLPDVLKTLIASRISRSR